jgi:hypothetical protein
MIIKMKIIRIQCWNYTNISQLFRVTDFSYEKHQYRYLYSLWKKKRDYSPLVLNKRLG